MQREREGLTGQWWSYFNTHWLHILQWCALSSYIKNWWNSMGKKTHLRSYLWHLRHLVISAAVTFTPLLLASQPTIHQHTLPEFQLRSSLPRPKQSTASLFGRLVSKARTNSTHIIVMYMQVDHHESTDRERYKRKIEWRCNDINWEKTSKNFARPHWE